MLKASKIDTWDTWNGVDSPLKVGGCSCREKGELGWDGVSGVQGL